MLVQIEWVQRRFGTASRAGGINSLAMMRQAAANGNYSVAIGSVSWA